MRYLLVVLSLAVTCVPAGAQCYGGNSYGYGYGAPSVYGYQSNAFPPVQQYYQSPSRPLLSISLQLGSRLHGFHGYNPYAAYGSAGPQLGPALQYQVPYYGNGGGYSFGGSSFAGPQSYGGYAPRY